MAFVFVFGGWVRAGVAVAVCHQKSGSCRMRNLQQRACSGPCGRRPFVRVASFKLNTRVCCCRAVVGLHGLALGSCVRSACRVLACDVCGAGVRAAAKDDGASPSSKFKDDIGYHQARHLSPGVADLAWKCFAHHGAELRRVFFFFARR